MSTRFKGLATPGNSSSNLTENMSFPSFKNTYFRNEAKRKTFVVKMSFVCMGKKIIFMSMASHLASLWQRALGNSEIAYSVTVFCIV